MTRIKYHFDTVKRDNATPLNLSLDRYPDAVFVGNLFRTRSGIFRCHLVNVFDVYVAKDTLLLKDIMNFFPAGGVRITCQEDIEKLTNGDLEDYRMWKTIFKYIKFAGGVLVMK